MGPSLQDEVACPDCSMTKKLARSVYGEVDQIIHHIQRLYHTSL